MASSKTGRKANAAVSKSNAPQQKDDGTRWQVWRNGRQVYPGPGVTRAHAEHLLQGLAEPAELVQVA